MSERETWEVLHVPGQQPQVRRRGGWHICEAATCEHARRIAKLPELERRVEELERLLRESEEQNDVLMQLMWGTHAS